MVIPTGIAPDTVFNATTRALYLSHRATDLLDDESPRDSTGLKSSEHSGTNSF